MKIKQGLEEAYANYVKINRDEYSKCVIDCGDIFGNLVDEGKDFNEAERIMLDDKRSDGITGFMMGAMMSGLVRFHPDGERIKAWWNDKEKNGTPDENGVNNPAILTI